MSFLTVNLLACACPPGAAINDISVATCVEDFGQIVRIMFQRTYSTGSTPNSFVYASDAPSLSASWQVYKTATDGTKIVQTPIVSNMEFTSGGVRNFGSGNQVYDGVPIILGREPSGATGSIYRTSQAIIKELKKLECEIGPSGGRLGAYFINKEGQILGKSNDNSIGGTPTNFYPIPLQSLSFGDLVPGGYDNVNTNNFEIGLPSGWSDDTIIIKPEAGFNLAKDW